MLHRLFLKCIRPSNISVPSYCLYRLYFIIDLRSKYLPACIPEFKMFCFFYFLQVVGGPCGYHGPYIFYKAIRISLPPKSPNGSINRSLVTTDAALAVATATATEDDCVVTADADVIPSLNNNCNNSKEIESDKHGLIERIKAEPKTDADCVVATTGKNGW